MADNEQPWLNDAIAGQETPADPDRQDATPETANDAPWLNDRLVEEASGDSFADKATTVARGATGSMLQSGGIVAGMGAGAAIGAAVAPPFAAFTAPVGAAIGGVAGYMAGNEARALASGVTLPGANAPLTYNNVEDLPENMRPYGYAGEVIGGGTPFAGGALAVARTGARLAPSFIGKGINSMLDKAAQYPASFMAAETSAIGSSAAASGAAETYYPGNTPVRMGAEIVAGLVSPVSIVAGLYGTGASTMRRVAGTLSTGARQTRAGQVIQDAVAQFGEDPEQLAIALRMSGLPGMDLTAAQKTGSAALIALEENLAKGNAQFGSEARKSAQQAFEAMGDMVTALRNTGDPKAFKAAAEIRQKYFNGLLTARLDDARRVALDAANKITKDTPAARKELGNIARNSVEIALREARAVENDLWLKIPKGKPANAGNLLKQYDDVRANLLIEEKLPDVIEGFVARMRDVQGSSNVGEILLFRSRALALAREADANKQFKNSRIYGQMAEAALDDLSGIADDVTHTATDARIFSRQLNETFRRTFAGSITASTREGADRIPPDLLINRVFSGGADATAMRMDELERATRFIPDMNINSPDAQLAMGAMVDAQERMLRIAAADAVDPKTGEISARRMAKFIRDNETMLDRFPQARKDLQDAVASDDALKAMERSYKGSTKAIDEKSAFAKVMELENPVDALTRAINNGDSPVRTIDNFAKLAKRSDPTALEGLKATVLDYAIRKNTAPNTRIDIGGIGLTLNEPIRPGQPSIMEIMVKNGVFTRSEADQMSLMFDQAGKITDALAGNGAISDLNNGPDMLIDMVASTIGARFGAMISQNNASLIAAGRGAQTARKVFDKVPRGKINSLLIEAAKDPVLMANLMERTSAPKEKILVGLRAHSYLWQLGLTEDTSDNE